MRVALCLLAIVAAVLGWGYWFSATHAYLQVDILDRALKTDREAYGAPLDATLELLDEAKRPLATTRTVLPYGYSTARHPTLGDCSALQGRGGNAYTECYEDYSRWASGWAKRTRFANLTSGKCVITDIPVTVTRSNTGWLWWWVPLPHVGGKPYSYIGLQVEVDSRRCARAG
jgi:hypothetical protein